MLLATIAQFASEASALAVLGAAGLGWANLYDRRREDPAPPAVDEAT